LDASTAAATSPVVEASNPAAIAEADSEAGAPGAPLSVEAAPAAEAAAAEAAEASPPAGEEPEPPDPGELLPPPVSAEPVETEIVGFDLHGQRIWEDLHILDLEIIAGEKRMLPLLRLLKALEIEHALERGRITIKPPGGKEVVLDLYTGEAAKAGETFRTEVVIAVSDISLEREAFVDADSVGRMLEIGRAHV